MKAPYIARICEIASHKRCNRHDGDTIEIKHHNPFQQHLVVSLKPMTWTASHRYRYCGMTRKFDVGSRIDLQGPLIDSDNVEELSSADGIMKLYFRFRTISDNEVVSVTCQLVEQLAKYIRFLRENEVIYT